MTFLLACAALILLLTGHWGWALTVLLLLLLLSPSGKTPSGTGNAPSLRPASYAPEERREHPAARVRRETTLVPLVRPAGPADVDYGVDAFAFHDWLASPDVTGTPAGGLEADGTASGMAGYNVAAGVKGELSVAHMLASKDLKGARVYLSCRNPGDASGAADIDLIVATGRTVWLLDAKHYAPARDGMWLVPTTADPTSWKPYDLRAYGPNANVEGVPLASLDGIAPDRSYHASGNMAWAADEIRKALPGISVRPVILLSRTVRGTYGVMRGTVFPGGVPVTTADAWAASFSSEGTPSKQSDYYLYKLLTSSPRLKPGDSLHSPDTERTSDRR